MAQDFILDWIKSGGTGILDRDGGTIMAQDFKVNPIMMHPTLEHQCTHPPEKNRTALETQVGGGHYKAMAIQVVEFCQKNNLDYCESNIVKYACRWREKGGLEDLKKIKHYVDLLIELEGLDD